MISLVTNVTSLFTQNELNINDNAESNTIEQLSSGYRINNSGNDAAGLAVANGLQAEIAELSQGVINAANGSSTLQIIDGGLSNISNLLDRLETLATEGASGTFSGSYTTLNNEFQSDLGEITRQAGNIGMASTVASGGLGTVTTTGTIGASQYNTTALAVFIGGGDSNTATDDQVTIDLTSNGGSGGNGVDALGLGLSASAVDTAGDAATALTAISILGTVQGKVGAGENLLNYATNLANSQITNLTSSESSIKDANVAAEAADLAQSQTLQQSTIAAMAQANSMPQALLKLLQ
jgi:flagellin